MHILAAKILKHDREAPVVEGAGAEYAHRVRVRQVLKGARFPAQAGEQVPPLCEARMEDLDRHISHLFPVESPIDGSSPPGTEVGLDDVAFVEEGGAEAGGRSVHDRFGMPGVERDHRISTKGQK
jgi:hypothetical protein